MNTFAVYLCFGLIALSAAQSIFRPGSVSAGYSASSVPSSGQVNINGGISSARFVASAPVVSSAGQFSSSIQGGNNYQGSASAGSAGQGSFQAFAPASQVNFNQAGGSAGVGVASSQGIAVGSSSAQGQAAFQAGAGAQQQIVVTKDFYIHSAPEEQEEVISTRQAASGPAHKNYRVVFIKTPSPKFTVSSAAISGALNEEKTVIYVLAKRPDLNVIQQQVAQHAQKASKPEVFFIKYQTPEEAQLAQQEIKAQYDALGGETNFSDEGVAPVHSVIGKAGGASAGAAVNAGAGVNVGAGVNAGVGAGVSSVSGSGSAAGVGSGFSSGAGFGAASGSGFSSGSGSASVSSAGSGAVSGVGSVSGSSSGSFGGAFGTFADGVIGVKNN